MAQLDQKVLQAVEKAARDGKLSCAEAHRLAQELGASLLTIGQACDELGIKIRNCQLGCF